MELLNYARCEDSTADLLMIKVFRGVMLYHWVSHDILKALCSCEILANPLTQHHSPVALNPQTLDS